MDHRVQALVDKDAIFKSYVRKNVAKVVIKLKDGQEYKASAGTYEAALDRCLSKVDSQLVSIKEQRRSKERARRQILEDLEDHYDEFH